MIAVDTNILIYAHRAESSFHTAAHQAIGQLIHQASPWGIPIACVHEFLAITTNSKIFSPPTPSRHALAQINAWLAAPFVHLLHTGATHLDTLANLIHKGQITGGQVHDARIAAICIENGVTEFWSCDRDFGKFPQLKTRNPLVS